MTCTGASKPWYLLANFALVSSIILMASSKLADLLRASKSWRSLEYIAAASRASDVESARRQIERGGAWGVVRVTRLTMWRIKNEISFELNMYAHEQAGMAVSETPQSEKL